jgi:hypothetical protein
MLCVLLGNVVASLAGPDSIRGFNFQHAVALHATLDLLDDSALAYIEIEGDDDVIDFQVYDVNDRRVRVAQVKSRSNAVGPQEIVDVILRWASLDATDAHFEYVTDAPLGKQAAGTLVPALDQLAAGEALNDEQKVYLSKRQLKDHALLARVRVVARQPPVGALLSQAEVRLARTVGSYRATALDEAEATVDRLFRRIAVAAGEGDRNLRRVTRQHVAAITGLDLAAIDAGGAWTQERAEAYRGAIQQRPQDVAVELAVTAAEVEAAALSLVGGRTHSSLSGTAATIVDVLDERAGGALVGVGGAGKTTSLGQLAVMAAARGMTPITPDVVSYRAGSLMRLLHQEVEAALEGPLSPRALEAPLATGEVVVFADAVTERPQQEAAALIADLKTLMRDWPVRVVATGRRSPTLASLALPVYQLHGLGWESREQVASELLGRRDGPLVARQIHERLGGAAENPLLFRMALSLVAQGTDPSSIQELYYEFISGLAARSGRDRPDAALLAAGRCALELVSEGRFEADSYSWLASMRAALDALPAGIFDVQGLSAEAAVEELSEIGLMAFRGAAAQLAFVHDSFRDFLAAQSIGREVVALPDPLDERYEQVALFLAQGAAPPSADLMRGLCDNPVAAASAADLPLGVGGDTRALSEELLQRLLGTYRLTSADLPEQPSLSRWAGPDRVYVALHAGTGVEAQSADEFESLAEQAALVIAFAEPPTALRASLLCWQELLRGELQRVGALGRPLPIPEDLDELIRAIAKLFEAKREALDATAEKLCPALAERLIETVGWRGLHAQVLEGQPDPFGAGTMHGLVYTYDTDGVRVEAKAGEEDADSVFISRTTAEHWLHDAPAAQAGSAIEKALGNLLPTWGPG